MDPTPPTPSSQATTPPPAGNTAPPTAPPAPPAPPTAPAPRLPRRSWITQLVPFVPIAIAIAVAFAASHYYAGRPASNHGMAMNPHAPAATPASHPAGRALREGDLAPDFTLPDAHGGTVTLSQLARKGPVLLIYYLGYNCPRCVAHLARVDDRKNDYNKFATQVVAVSPNSLADLRASVEQYGDFYFPLLADDGMKVAHALGLVHGTTLFHGTYVMDTDRRIRLAMQSSHPYDDEEKILALLQSLRN